MAFSLFSRKKPFTHDFFKDWIKTLTETCIPSLQGSASTAAYSSTQSIDVSLVHRYFVSYYEFLNNTADTKTISHLLFSSWRNSFETPFLFLGDIHPYILTNLVRSLIIQGNIDAEVNPSELGFTDLDHPWTKTRSWKHPSEALLKTLEDVDQDMKQSVLALHDRMGQAQFRLVNRVSASWVQSNYGKDGRNEQTVLDTSSSVAVDDAALEDMMELVSIFVDANLLRMKVITGLIKPMNNSQAAQYLESLCKFFAGFTIHILPNPSLVYTVFVGGLAPEVDPSRLYETFKSKYASVTKAKIVCYGDSGKSRGYGFVSFEDKSEQNNALREMEGFFLLNKPMRLGPATRNFI